MTDVNAAAGEKLAFAWEGRSAFHPDSLAASLSRFRLENDIDDGPVCRSRCRYRAFPVSETEFVLILDEMLRTWSPESISKCIRLSKENRRRLETELPDLAEKIGGRLSLWEIFQLERSVLPFDCVFCADGSCSLRRVRPLACAGLETPVDFLFLSLEKRVIFRRPLPLFWWFSIVFRDEETLESIADTPFYRGITRMSEQEYTTSLVDYLSK